MQEYVNIDAKGNILDVLKKMNEGFEHSSKSSKAFEQTATGSLQKIQNQLKSVSFASFTQNLQNLNQGLKDLNDPGLKFETSLKEVSALTGVTGKALDELGEKARASAKEFGGSATDSLESYKTILSRFGPDIAKDQKALGAMEKDVRILSKTMGGDAAGAVDALTTGMLQFGVDLSNPKTAAQEMSRMMNVMAAGAQEGAAEVPQISAALKVAGVQAKLSKVSFEETNAALQALAAGGKEGSEAGIGLRNVLGKMAGEDIIPKEAVAKLRALGVDMSIVSDTTRPFTERLRELKKAQGDATVMAQVFGTENAAAANILLSSVDAQDALTKKITGTTSAQEQAKIVMESREEQMSRFNARIEDAKISFFNATGGATAFLEPVSQLATTFASFAPLVSGAAGMISKLANSELFSAIATKAITAAQWLWNVAMEANPIGLIIIGLAALGAAVYATVKAFDTSTAAQKINAEVSKKVNTAMIDEQVQLDLLFSQLKKTNPETDERRRLVEELNGKYPDLLAKYDLEKTKLGDIDKIQKEVIKNMRNKITAQIKTEKATELMKKAEDMKSDNDYLWHNGNDAKWEEIRGLNKEADRLLGEVEDIQTKGAVAMLPKKEKIGDPPITDDNKPPALTGPGGYTPSKTPVEKSMSGAGEVKRIDVRIDTLVRTINVNTTNLKEGLSDIRKQVSEAIIGGVRDFEVAI